MAEELEETMLAGQDNTDTVAGNADVNTQVDAQQNADVAEGAETQQPEGDEGNQNQEAVTFEDFTLPEGVVLDEELMTEFLPFAQELKLDQEGAQKFIDMGSKIAQKMQQQQLDAWQEQLAGWTEQTRNDAELGGKNLANTLAVARTALESFASPEFNELLKASGIGNHPEMIRFAHRIGKAIGNDVLVTGASNGAAQRRN